MHQCRAARPPAGLAEGPQDVDALLRGPVRGVAEIHIRQIVYLDDLFHHLVRPGDDVRGGKEPQLSHDRIEGDHFRRLLEVMGQGIGKQSRGLVDEFAIETLAPAHLLRNAPSALLLVLGEPRRRKGRARADGGACQGSGGWDIGGVHCRVIQLIARAPPWRAAVDPRCGWRPGAAA